ncbi:MAG: hypothetical protein ACKO28_05085 [Cyanobium sp.]
MLFSRPPAAYASLPVLAGDGNGRLARAQGISAQILRERESFYKAVELPSAAAAVSYSGITR